MTKTRLRAALRRQVMADFRNRCAYCHTLTAITGARLVIDHIIPEAAGGPTSRENLCLACHSCNEFKGVQTEALDPLTAEPTPLFHPRQQQWRDHFAWSAAGSEIIGRTPVGRATLVALNLNHPDIVEARRRWTKVGWHPPDDDL